MKRVAVCLYVCLFVCLFVVVVYCGIFGVVCLFVG